MKSISAIAPGKCILFGEHSVVYGYPAIAMAISLYSKCTIAEMGSFRYIGELRNPTSRDTISIITQKYGIYKNLTLNNIKNELPKSIRQLGLCLDIFNERFSIDFKGTEFNIKSDIFSGLGSSASTAVAFTSAINEYYDLKLKRETISEIAFEMEMFLHGNPSGIDNTICTYGNLIYYQKGEFETLKIPNNINTLITYTDKEHDTKAAIEKVKAYKNENPEISRKILKQMGDIAESAKDSLIKGNINELGRLMNENQECLSTLGVSNEIIEELIAIALNNSAYGAKITGAGLGGCIISIGEVENLQRLQDIFERGGYKSFLVSRDQEGVRIESK